MLKETRRILPILLATLLLLSTPLVMVGKAQSTIDGSLLVAPNPVGVNQLVSGIVLTQPPTASLTCTIYITHPDGSSETKEAVTNSLGVASFSYTPTSIGTHTIDLFLPSDEFPRDSVSLTVQEAAVAPAVPVAPGDEVTVYPDATKHRISLHFQHVTSSGVATVSRTTEPPEGVTPLEGIITDYFDFGVTFVFTGVATVGLPYEENGLMKPEELLTMWHYEAVVGDIDGNGIVNWADLFLIIRALGSTPGSRRWNVACDLNHDGRVTGTDLVIALRNLGKSGFDWANVTIDVDTVNNIVFGATTSFPPFGIRLR